MRAINFSRVFVAISLAGCAFAETPQEGEVRHATERVFAAFTHGDVSAFMSLCSAKSPRYDAWKQGMPKIFADLGKMRLAGVKVDNLTVSDSQADGVATAQIERLDPKTDTWQKSDFVRQVRFVHDAGEWKLFYFAAGTKRLAVSYLQAKPEERTAALAGVEDWQVVDIAKLILGYADSSAEEKNFPEAHRAADAACAFAQAEESKEALARCHFAQGGISSAENRPEAAIAAYLQAQEEFRQAGDLTDQLKSIIEQAKAEILAGKTADTFSHLRDADQLRSKLNDPMIESDVLYGFAGLYQMAGNQTEAIKALQAGAQAAARANSPEGKKRAADLSRAAGDFIRATSSDMPGLFAALRQYVEAFRFASQADDRKTMAKAIRSQSTIMIGLCISRTIRWQMDRSVDYAEPCLQAEEALYLALHACDAAGVTEERTEILLRIGNLYKTLGRTEEAFQKYTEAYDAAEATHKISTEILIKNAAGQLLASKKRWPEAIQSFRQAVELAKKVDINTGTFSGDTQVVTPDTLPGVYFNLASALLQGSGSARDVEQAFESSERAKAQTLVTMLSHERVDLTAAMNADEKAREREIDKRVEQARMAADRARTEPDVSREKFEQLDQQLSQALAERQLFRDQMFRAHPELQASRAQSEPADLRQINQLLFASDPGTAILSYFTGSEEILLFALTRADRIDQPAKIKAYRLKVPSGLATSVADFQEKCAKGGEYQAAAKQLYSQLLETAAKDFAPATTWIISPDRYLHTLPFQALQNAAGRFLIEDHAVSYAPSVTALIQMHKLAVARRQQRPGGLRMLAVGRPVSSRYPDLQFSGDEAREVAAAFGETAVTGQDATPSRIKSEMPKARFIHFATHVVVYPDAPMSSAIVLTPEDNNVGLVEAREIADMSLQAEMVVLSGCESGAGREVEGEGIVGLMWAFFAARTPATVVTLWQIGDASARSLMVSFYRDLRAASKITALRQAQLTFIHDAARRHPKYWAPFILVGDWM